MEKIRTTRAVSKPNPDAYKVERVHVAFNDNPAFTPARNWFVSLDRENWLGVNCDASGATVEEVRALFDGNGKTVPMRMARRFLTDMIGGVTTFVD